MEGGVMVAETDLKSYAVGQIAARLGKLAYEVRGVAQRTDEETVHDLRVAIRRFAQGLMTFSTLLPKREVKKIRKKLRGVMEAAGDIRDRDIALELMKGAGLRKSDGLWKQVIVDRKDAERRLIKQVKRWNRSNFSAKWRSALELT